MQPTTEEKYQQLEHREHIYKLPDTYIGSIEPTTQEMFVIDMNVKMVYKTITYIPGFFKIFDEILVNATDHRQRDESVKNIKIHFETGLSEIVVQNDGSGIDICKHAKTGLYVPEMLFGHLLTSSNYNPNEKRTVGGKNGYGATVTNIFSEYFVVETVDSTRQLKYVQKFTDNGKTIHAAKITKYAGKPYTKITFKPDYPKFNLPTGITDDIYALFQKRVYDATAVTPKDLSVTLNNTKLKIKSMEKYIELYLPEGYKVFYMEQPRWKVGVVLSPNREYHQVSFVNGIWTLKGGRHVDYILNQVIDRTKAVLSKSTKTKNKVFKTSQIKDNIWIFVDAVIENPSFTSQTKEEMTSKVSQFGSSCTVDESWVEKWMKHTPSDGCGLFERLLENTRMEEQKNMKKTDGNKRSIIKGIPKLEDAIQAGTRNSTKCTLILCEGDSAKASILSGVSVLGNQREYYGIFPLRGKFINVRDTSLDKVNANEEVKNLKTILGLQHGKVYNPENLKELRYGAIAIATDADCDGSHIKALVMNFLHYFWPSLLGIDGFLKTLYTPIVKGFRGQQVVSFYNLNEYHQFKQQHENERWTYKYFKGLGTSTSKEFKEYFQHLADITASYRLDEDESLLMAFSKDRSDQRKDWLQTYNPEDTLTFEKRQVIPISNFVHKELKHFSNYDNYRSIPNVLDGLKPSQRKVLYGMMKKHPVKEIKVAQLASFVSEVTQYHHGEVSLEQTIVGMAQRFVGKNNVPLLKAIGQFGTRLSGGKDNAQSRYIFTALEDSTLRIFHPHDEPLLRYLEEEDKPIEPFAYVPILPMILVNGADGIGTGYSTQIPCFNPKELVDSLKARCKDNTAFKDEWVPFYNHFKGTILPAGAQKFVATGVYRLAGQNLTITELPIGMWTNNYREHLESLLTSGAIASYVSKSTDDTVHFDIVLSKAFDEPSILKTFKLQNTISLGNMHAYRGTESRMHKFQSVREILEYFFTERLELYRKRKEYQLQQFHQKLELLDEKIRFITLVMEDPYVVFKRPKKEIADSLRAQGFRHVETLLQLSIGVWTQEKITELTKETQNLRKEMETLLGKDERTLYYEDLSALTL
jgi:DNA topoisomerase-2